MTRQTMFRALVGLPLVALSACAPFRRGPAGSDAVLIFRNESVDQATVYAALSTANFVRLGTVFAGQTDTLDVPVAVTARGQQVNIVARRFAEGDYAQSGSMLISRGDAYHVVLYTNQRLLSVMPVEVAEGPKH